ncbi:MAG: response regulator transcription factor [Candidatus Omnitrophota bacterium]
MKILVVEDNKDIQKLLRLNLIQENFEVIQAFDGEEGLSLAKESSPDLILLDINLPKINGIELCRQLKSNPALRHIPILILTVRKEEVDRIIGFELGAEDYVAKPFSPRELILRIKAILRRQDKPQGFLRLEAGDLSLDENSFEVKVAGKVKPLTSTEFKLLKYLMLNKGRLLSRENLLHNVWGYNHEIDSRTVDAHIKSLRRKIPSRKVKIATIIGMGYKLSEDV